MPTPFDHPRTIHFSDTDAAGVVFFARYYSICHEAYEESLAASGIQLSDFFKSSGTVIPITASQARYRRPLACGDRILVSVLPRRLSENSFAIDYELKKQGPHGKLVAQLSTEHVCISADSRGRVPIPELISNWIEKYI